MKMYRGVVEDNNDPLNVGRVKVRIFGLHTQDNENTSSPKNGKFGIIKSSDLVWAEVNGPTSFGLVSGVGVSSVLLQGTWVRVILENDNPNKPVVFGTISGTSQQRKKYADGEGFNDKDGIYPLDARLTEPDIHRFVRNDKLNAQTYDTPKSVYSSKDTPHKQINDNVDKVTTTDSVSGADATQTEPNSTNDASTYPNNNVIETASGHVIEFDDTPNNERIRLYHTSGSYFEIKPDGTFVQKSVNATGKNHFIAMADVEEHIAKNVRRLIEQNLDEIVSQNVRRHIGANLDEHITKTVTRQIDINLVDHVKGDATITVDGNLTWNVTGNVNMNCSGSYTDQITNGYTLNAASETISVSGDSSLTASGKVLIDGTASATMNSSGSSTVSGSSSATLSSSATASVSAPMVNIN